MRPRAALVVLAALCLALGLAVPARAHKVAAYAYVQDGRLVGEAYFAGGQKVLNSPVTVTDATGKEVASGQTDQAGAFNLPIPQGQAPFLLVVRAGQGHQGQYEIRAEDLGQAAAAPAGEPAATAAPASAPAAPTAPGLDAAELERVLSAKLAPLQAQIARLAEGQDEVSARDVVGGLGWIVGLAGLGAWWAARKKG